MIYVVGTGPGDPMMLTLAAQYLIDQADVLAGWPRLLNLYPDFRGERLELSGSMDNMLESLSAHVSRNVVVLASGDPLLFGIGKRICEHFSADERQCVPGISAIQMLFSEIGLDMNDLYITSSHGKTPDFDFLFAHRKVALVTDHSIGPYQLAQEALNYSPDCTFIIGENLGYAEQRISILRPAQVQPEYDMNVVVILNER